MVRFSWIFELLQIFIFGSVRFLKTKKKNLVWLFLIRFESNRRLNTLKHKEIHRSISMHTRTWILQPLIRDAPHKIFGAADLSSFDPCNAKWFNFFSSFTLKLKLKLQILRMSKVQTTKKILRQSKFWAFHESVPWCRDGYKCTLEGASKWGPLHEVWPRAILNWCRIGILGDPTRNHVTWPKIGGCINHISCDAWFYN